MSKSPFLLLSISLMLGIIMRDFYHPLWVWTALSMGIVSLFFFRAKKFFWFLLAIVAGCLGIVVAHLDFYPAPTSLQEQLKSRVLPLRISVIGEVLTEPEIKTSGRKRTVSFLLGVSKIYFDGKDSQRKRILCEGKIQVFANQPDQIPEIDDPVRLWGNIQAPEPVLNPGGFDYKRYLEMQDVYFIFNSYGRRALKVLPDAKRPFLQWRRFLGRMRQSIREKIEDLFIKEDAVWIRALILGDRKDLRGKLLDDFLKTGTSHLLAISGLNISLVAGSLYLMLIFFRLEQKKAAWIALLVAVFQVAIAGFGIPVQRAGIMAGFGFLALIFERERDGINLFFLALFCLLLADTRNLFSISFQLSFLSVFCLILFSRMWQRSLPWAEAWISSLAVLAGTMPIVIYHFNTVSPIGILTNILGIPLFHFILLAAFLALSLAFIPWLGWGIAKICSGFIKLGLGWIHLCGLARWGYFYQARPSWLQIFSYYSLLGGALAAFKYPTMRNKYPYLWGILLVGWLGCAGVMFLERDADKAFRLTIFSAGTNDLAHLQFDSDNQWLVNAGRTFPGDQVRWIVEPYLKSQGTKKIKGVLFTDHSKRHLAGYDALKQKFQFEYEIYPFRRNHEDQGGDKKYFLGKEDSLLMPEGSKIQIYDVYHEKFIFVLEKSDQKILFLPEVSYGVLRKLLDGDKIPKAQILIFPSQRCEGDFLKAVLTLTQATCVISPKLNEVSRSILKERQAQYFDPASAGAIQIHLDSLEKQWRVESYLKRV